MFPRSTSTSTFSLWSIAGDVLFFASIFVLMEVGFRVAQPSWGMAPSSETTTRGHPIRHNSAGFRGEEFPRSKPNDVYRVLVFGNSTTFGSGVAEEDRYTELMVADLAEAAPGRVFQVLNAGRLSSSVADFQSYWDATGAELEPDLVVVGFSPGMLTRSFEAGSNPTTPSTLSRIKTDVKALPRAVHIGLHSTWAYSTLDTVYRQSLYRIGVMHVRLDQWVGVPMAYAFDVPGVDAERTDVLYHNIEQDLQKLAHSLERQGVSLLVLCIPSRFEISDAPGDNNRNFPLDKIRVDPTSRMRDIASRNDFGFVDLKAKMKIARSAGDADAPFYIAHDFTHLDLSGHQLASQSLVEVILAGEGH